MAKTYIPFLAFLVLLFITIPFSFAASVVPGWHVTILPPYFIFTNILAIVFLFVVLGYWLLQQKTTRINWIFFTVHFLLTLPAVIFIKLPAIFLEFNNTNQEEFLESLSLRIALLPWVWALFAIGQIAFLIYFIRIFISKRRM